MTEEDEKSLEEEIQLNFDPIPHNHFECERVVINVGGERYETQLTTLVQFPKTLLGNRERMLKYFDPTRNEYFFDRNRPSFDAILYFYQSGGKLCRPLDVSLDTFIEEIEFYELGEEKIEAFKIEEGFMKEEEEPLPKNLFKRDIYLLLEHPETSTFAKVFAVFSVFVICFSIFLFCTETVLTFNRYTLYKINENLTSVEEDELPDFGNPFFVLESMCVGWFTFEILLRFFTCPDKMVFVKDIMNIVDVIAILPYFLTLSAVLTEDENAFINKETGNGELNEEEEGFSLANLKVTRLARVFRIFKLSRHSKGLRIILMTFKASMDIIWLLVYLLLILTVLFSSIVYFAEANDENSYFKCIPDAFWWAMVTMTTVGYGDVTPIGMWGKMVGMCCVFAGLLTLALPAPFIETNFLHFYTRESKQHEFFSYNPDHIESCPFLPDHSKMNFGSTNSESIFDLYMSTYKAKKEAEVAKEMERKKNIILEGEEDEGEEEIEATE